MLLKRLQDLIGGIYDVSVAHNVYDFLVTDRTSLPACAQGRGPTDEELIVAQPEEGAGDEIAMALYLDPQVLARLDDADPMESLHHGNVADYWTALEGVSHFLYLAWNAGHDKPVSLLELEMQAEVDKYVASYWLLRRQFPQRFPAELLRLLFQRTRIDPQLAAERAGLYRAASGYAERFCRRLECSLRRARGRSEADVLAELRRFYRFSNARKVAYIERTGR
ncbi:MAG TPA: hypothetical protein VLX90_00855 [Steroidobacteraceae bacterium]|nr:hypothetical protein [Steroidobacteraceae bacterium]